MAAFFGSPISTPRAAPRRLPPHASINADQSIWPRQRPRVEGSAGEMLLLLWTLLVLAFSFLVIVGFID